MAHAKLSPSASHRWMNCAGSVALIGDESSTTNNAARLGTAAHKMLELMIIARETEARAYLGTTFLVKGAGDEDVEYYPAGTPALKGGPRPDWYMYVVDEKMVEGVQATINEVYRLMEEMAEGTEIFSERFLDMTWLDSRLGGTADVTLVEPFGKANLVDHKNGFIIVEAKDNDQLKQYAVGIAHEHPDCEEVTVTISQPNAPHIEGLVRSETFSRAELDEYAVKMKEGAEATSKPNAPLRAGDWCLWCPAKTRCKEYDAMLLEEANADFAEEPPAMIAPPVGTDELARKMAWVPTIEAWINNIKADIQRELENGNKVPGWKLVRGRAHRKWSDSNEAIIEKVGALGVDEAELFVPAKLKSPAQVEKLGTGKDQRKAVKNAVSELAFMPQGQLAIAPDYDPREEASALEDAANEFMTVDDGEDFE